MRTPPPDGGGGGTFIDAQGRPSGEPTDRQVVDEFAWAFVLKPQGAVDPSLVGGRIVLQVALDEAQRDVTGTVRVKLYKGTCTVVGRKSPRSLYRLDMATFEEDDVYRQKDAEGFIRLNALRLAIRAQRKKRSTR